MSSLYRNVVWSAVISIALIMTWAAHAHTHANPDDDEVLLEGQVRTPSSPEEQKETKQKEKEKPLTIVRPLLRLALVAALVSCW